jgi:signal transduction histidine kinase
MLAPFASLRMWVAAAMAGTALIGVVIAYLLVGSFEQKTSRRADARKARAVAVAVAAAVAGRVASGTGPADLATFQRLLPNDRIVVRDRGAVIFAGPALTGRALETAATAPIPGSRGGGSVKIEDHSSPGGSRAALAAVLAGVALMVIAAALLVARRLTRAIRAPVQRAIAAADRVAAGDFSARMGTEGPEELAHLGRAFDAMAARLETLERDQRRFLADVAHEIATPVGTLAGFGLALADGSLSAPAERTEAAAVIEAERERIGRLLDDLRELNSLERGAPPARERLDVAELVRTVAARFAPAATAADVRLRVRGHRTTTRTDRHLVETIVANLVSNAIRYTPAGGRVDVAVHRELHGVAIAVRDTGIGIAPEHRERIFDRLYRVDDARDRAHGGAGLGLAIVREAARALGARIEVDSAPGRGSEFRVVLGRAEPPPAPTPAGSNDGRSASTSRPA